VGFRVQGLDHVALGVGDQEASRRWYADVLGLHREYEAEWGDTPVALMEGGSGLALFRSPGSQSPAMRHIAFRVDAENFALAQDELRRRGIDFEHEDHDVARSIYFEDPDGLQLELTTYERA
jgi:catechol 2,3-dioxygenase-like lactoylglutathione lyase family enzyme